MDEQEELIEKYLDGLLTETELTHFETELAHNEELTKRVSIEKDLLEGIESFGNLDLKKQLKRIHQETITPIPTKKIGVSIFLKRRRILIAAALVGIIGTIWYFFPLPKVTSVTLYATYAKHDFNFQEKNTSDGILAEAENLLKNEDYKKALPLLNEHLKQNLDDAQILLAKGIVLTEIGVDYDGALVVFRRLQKEFPIYRDEGYWYEGLLFLKKGEIEKVMSNLEQISIESQRNTTKKELLLKIKEFDNQN